jgi:hypothetical protein
MIGYELAEFPELFWWVSAEWEVWGGGEYWVDGIGNSLWVSNFWSGWADSVVGRWVPCRRVLSIVELNF